MANTKTTAKSTKKVEEVKNVEEKVIEKGEEKSIDEVSILKQQLEEMRKAMEALIKEKSEASVPSSKIIVRNEEDEVIIGCRVLQGIGWSDPTGAAGDIRLAFNEEQSVSVSDMKRFFRQHSVKKLFEDGLCYFVEPESYALFNIRKHIDLSDEKLIEILTNSDLNEIVRELNRLTDNKKNSSIINCLVFRICEMIRKHILNWDYYTRKGIEDYFSMEFDRGIATLDAIDSIRG